MSTPFEIACEPGRDRDAELEPRLVARMVVGREPGRGDVRLTDDDRPVVGVDEAGQAEVFERLRDAVVPEDHREERAVGDARFGVTVSSPPLRLVFAARR